MIHDPIKIPEVRKMEKEGMMIDYFEVINNVDHANYVGKKIG